MFISAYRLGSEKSEEEIAEFWNKLHLFVGSFGWNESVVVLGDLNTKVGNDVIEGIVGQHLVPGRNECGERLPQMCAEIEFVVVNCWFRKNYVYKYMCVRMVEGRVVGRALMDYVLLLRHILSALPMLYTPHSYVPHPFHIPHQLPLETLGT